jgi:hypothetical protein
MPNRIEARSAKAALTHATGRLPLLRLFSTPLVDVWVERLHLRVPAGKACSGLALGGRVRSQESALPARRCPLRSSWG